MQQACIVTVEITESDKLLLPLPQSLSDAVCPLSAGDDDASLVSVVTRMALKLARPFAAMTVAAADPSNPSRQMRVVVVACLVGWASLRRSAM